MSATNHTTNYNLPQFVGTDKPAWLGDINPAMNAIDTQMKANADGVADILDMFNLSVQTSKNADTLINVAGLTATGVLKIAQNVDGSIFKFYNYINIVNTTNETKLISLVPIPGMEGLYGLKVLQLNQAPEEAYVINGAGTGVYKSNGGTTLQDINLDNIFVGTDGWVYILGNATNTWGVNAGQYMRHFYHPCVYFNANFGDE